jgi:hypothetical protein
MNDTTAMLERIKGELKDEGVFSQDQILKLESFADDLDEYINSKLENFAMMNFI